MKNIPIEISARHAHLSKKEASILFGNDYSLNVLKDLSQTGEFAAKETITIKGPKREIKNVRVIGPFRKFTQIEISKTDGYFIGVVPPVRVSGDIEGTPGIKIIGPKGEVEVKEGLILAKRHIHMNPMNAAEFQVSDQELVSVKVPGERGLIFNNVAIRVKENYNLSFQIDTDEGNAGGIENGDAGELII